MTDTWDAGCLSGSADASHYVHYLYRSMYGFQVVLRPHRADEVKVLPSSIKGRHA